MENLPWQKRKDSTGGNENGNDNQLEIGWNINNDDNNKETINFDERQQWELSLPPFNFQQQQEDDGRKSYRQNSQLLEEYDFNGPSRLYNNADYYQHRMEHDVYDEEQNIHQGEHRGNSTSTSNADDVHRSLKPSSSAQHTPSPIALSQATLQETLDDRQHLEDQQSTRNENRVVSIFIMILLKILQEKNPRLRLRAKQVIRQCTLLNRSGHSDFIPLIDSLRTNLYPVVGEAYWRQCERCTRRYMTVTELAARQQQQMMIQATSAAAAAAATSEVTSSASQAKKSYGSQQNRSF